MTEIDRETIKALIREVLAEAFSDDPTSTSPATVDAWVPLKDAVKPLGYPSADALRRAIACGTLRVGKEARDRRNPGAKKPIYQVNLEKAKKRLSEDPSKRRSV